MLIKKDRRKNNFKKSFTTKVDELILCLYSMLLIWTFDDTENKHDVYRNEDCIMLINKQKK